MKKLSVLFTALVVSCSSVLFANNNNQHEMENMQVTIEASEHRNSRFIDSKKINSKECILGKDGNYNRKGEANGNKGVWPYAEYNIVTKSASNATYHVTVHYRVDKDKVADNPKLLIGMDLLEPEEVEIKNKNAGTVRASFNVKMIKGKNHTLKVWFPSAGIAVDKFDIRRAIIKQND